MADAVSDAENIVGDYAALEAAVGAVLFNVSNFPDRAQARLMGQDMRPLREKIVDAVQAAGFVRVSKGARNG